MRVEEEKEVYNKVASGGPLSPPTQVRGRPDGI